MKTLLLFIGIIASSCYAQVSFEPGYYIDNKNQKIPGFIRNSDWLNNPASIDFKGTEDGEAITLDKNEVKEFFVGLSHHYKRFDLKVDLSPSDLQDLTTTSAPVWKTEQSLIKVLAEGPATLYYYGDYSLTRYFFSKSPHENAEQLVFKEYRNAGSKIFQNYAFRQQLLMLFVDQGLTVSQVNKVAYKESDLTKLFAAYGSKLVESRTQTKNIKSLHLHLVVGASLYRVNFQDYVRNRAYEISGTTILPQLEMEYTFNFNRQKWSMFLAAGYQSCTNETDGNSLDYTFIPVSFGFRHGLFINKKSKILLEAGASANLAQSSSIKYSYSNNSNPEFDISESVGIFAGAGYSWNRLTLSGRYNLNRELLKYNSQSLKFSAFDVMLKYRIL